MTRLLIFAMRTSLRSLALVLSTLILASALVADLPPRRGKPDAVPPPINIAPAEPPVLEISEGLTAEWLSTPRPIGVLEDLTAATGVQITGGVAYWGTPVEGRIVHHVAGRTPGGDLYVFYWDAGGMARAVNVSAKTGVKIASDPVGWLGPTPYEHIAAITSAGVLYDFFWSPASDWGALPISPSSGKTFAGNVVQWTTFIAPPVSHLAAVTTAGEIYVFYRKGEFVPYSRVDVTAKTGVRAAGVGGAWVTDDFREHLVVSGTDKKLYELVWSSARDWTPFPIPLPQGVTADVTAKGHWAMENIAVRSVNDELFRLWRSHGSTGPWGIVNDSQIDGERVLGRPAFSAYAEHTAVRGVDGELFAFTPMSNVIITPIISLSDLVGMTASGTAATWFPDSIAAAGTDSHLRVIRDWGEARRLTERLMQPFQSLRYQRGERKTVTILWNPETTLANCRTPTGTGCITPCDPTQIGAGVKLKFQKAAAVDAMVKINDYFRENSAGLVSLNNVATLGWYTSTKFGAHYWQDHGPGKCMDGWNTPGSGDVEKWAEAIRKADAEFNFAAYDTDGNKVLTENELAVVIMIPNPAGPAGFVRGVVAENNTPLVVDGVTVPQITEVYVESREKPGSDYTDGIPDLGLIAHELSHHLFNHVDMYWDWAKLPPTALLNHAVMDYGWGGGHHDPWTKLKFQWARPRIIWHPGRYAVRDVETRHMVRALLHPTRGGGEFLLFENRLRGTTFDRSLSADGLAIYHVMEDPAVYQRSRPPFYWTDAQWATINVNDWGHRSIRMLRPVSTSGVVFDGGSSEGYSDFWSVWRAGTARTSYDLEPFPTTREHAWVRWGDGANPGFAVRDISAAGAEMKFTISLTSLANPGLCAAAGKNCGWIPDGYGGLAYCGECTRGTCGGGVPNVCGCTPKRCESGYCGTLSDGCGGTITCGPCDELERCYRNRCVPIPEPCECGGRPPNCFPCPQESKRPPE